MIEEKSRLTETTDKYDVVVIGGGIAGVAAALASARNGAKTLVIEKSYLLGGLATSGLVTIYLPLCDGKGKQVSFGIAEELLKLSVKYGYEPNQLRDKCYNAWLCGGTAEDRIKYRYQVQFNANVYAILLEQLLRENGIDILYGTMLCDSVTVGQKITHIITESKSGRHAYSAKSFVDASGDADLCKLSSAKTETFKQGNILASWYYHQTGDTYALKMLGFSDTPDKYKTDKPKVNQKRYAGLTAEELSEMTFDAHNNLLRDFLKDGNVSASHSLATVSTIPQIRMTRRIVGKYTVCDEESYKRFDDSIGLISDWRKAGPIYELPFGCLFGEEVKNLITCGRCISVSDDMWDITRVIPACAVTGEAAGTAASISEDFSSLDINSLQKELKNNGVVLHIDDLK